MSEQQTPRLTPELVSMAISGGMLDESLTALADIIRSRQKVLAAQKAGAMMPGDRFLITNCSPKKWNGVEVEYKSRDGMWLVCRVVHEHERQRINASREVRLRETHVGTFLHHHSWGGV